MPPVRDTENGTRPDLKAVPGAKRDEIVGPLGERLKLRVSAPPEGGRANDAIRAMLASALGVPRKSVSIESGASRHEKTVRIEGIDAAAVRERLGL